MKTLGNFLWIIFGGWLMALMWLLTGCIAFITVVGIPWGRACFMLASFSLFPFGRVVIDRKALTGNDDIGTGKWGTVGNIVWFLLAGWGLALSHAVCGVVFCISLIGIPFGVQHFKLAGAGLFPVGKTVVDQHLAEAAYKRNAEAQLSTIRS